jgi:peptidoglycan/LPS O-acetylase OafA/YrhL
VDSKKIFVALTSMRGVAALLVVFYHLRYGFVPVPDFNLFVFRFRFGDKGYFWVDFFFILSGFILAHRYSAACTQLNRRVYFDFVWHRFAQVWPLHAVTLAVAVGYLAWKNGAHFLRLDAILANVFLVHGWGHYFLPFTPDSS